MVQRTGDTIGPKINNVRRVVVATDRSVTADRAVRWAADLAAPFGAELILTQVLVPEADGGADGVEPTDRAQRALREYAQAIAGPSARARVVVDADPAAAILGVVEEEGADVVVVGNVGMRGRRQFLLGNIPNRISHNARCTVVIVNSGGDDGVSGAAVARGLTASADTSRAVDSHLLARAWRIGRVLARAGLRELLERPAADDPRTERLRAQRLRAALEELGPTFAKIGQILSTRPDLLPPAFIEELATLQEHVTPLTEAEVVAAMERELGVPWEDVFAGIDPTPLATGTIAQVHRATLENGDRVVVKVQRPTAEHDILQDLELLQLLAAKLGARPRLRRVFDVQTIVDDLARSLRRELDFRSEAGNLRRMREILQPFSRLAVPDVYESYSTARLLVMQEVQGVPVRQAPAGPARAEAARQLLESYYGQVMGDGFFHADPHPGNMKWWNDRIYLLDLGMVGELTPETRELLVLLVLAFAQQDAAFLGEIVQLLAGAEQPVDPAELASFQAALAALIDRYRSLSIDQIQLGPLFQEITAIAVRHNIRVPPSLVLAGKAFAQMQQVAAELDPTLDPFDVAQRFLLRRTLRQLTRDLNPQRAFYEGQKLRLRLTRLLEAVEFASGARPGAPLQVQFRGDTLEATVAQLGRRVSLGLGLAGSLIGTAILAGAPGLPRWAPSALGGLSGVLAAGLLADIRRSR
jgi:ubiquinone biosynthesis protein